MNPPIGIGTRQDHTLGRLAIPQSPYTSSPQLCRRMSADGGLWAIISVIDRRRVRITNTETCQYATLIMDGRGRWWIGVKLGRVWLPDLDKTEKLARHIQADEIASYGNYTRDEVAEMRHPTW